MFLQPYVLEQCCYFKMHNAAAQARATPERPTTGEKHPLSPVACSGWLGLITSFTILYLPYSEPLVSLTP